MEDIFEREKAKDLRKRKISKRKLIKKEGKRQWDEREEKER